MSSRTFNWSRTAKSSLVKVTKPDIPLPMLEHLLTRNLKQHLVRPSDPIAARSAQAPNVRAEQVAEFSGSSESQDRLGHRAKEKLLDRVGSRSLSSFFFVSYANGCVFGLGILSQPPELRID